MDEDRIAAEEFLSWLTPAQAIDRYSHLRWDEAARYIWRRAQSGLIAVVAETVHLNDGEDPGRLVRLPPELLNAKAALEDVEFWKSGDTEIHAYQDGPVGLLISSGFASLFDVRFDPDGMPSPSVAHEEESKNRNDVPRADIERFAKALLHGWPEMTERDAYAKAKLFFPDNRVSREPFLEIFRAIRGPRNPGKPPNQGN